MASDRIRVSTMLALEGLITRAARDGDLFMLGIACEAWERSGMASMWLGWIVSDAGFQGHDAPKRWTDDEAFELVRLARFRKNHAKLRHQADALLATIDCIPLDEKEWQHVKWRLMDRSLGAVLA